MAMPVSRAGLGSLLMACSLAVVADDELPEIEFLEYLGSWEESDEDWTMFMASMDTANETDKRTDPTPEGEASAETDDED